MAILGLYVRERSCPGFWSMQHPPPLPTPPSLSGCWVMGNTSLTSGGAATAFPHCQQLVHLTTDDLREMLWSDFCLFLSNQEGVGYERINTFSNCHWMWLLVCVSMNLTRPLHYIDPAAVCSSTQWAGVPVCVSLLIKEEAENMFVVVLKCSIKALYLK